MRATVLILALWLLAAPEALLAQTPDLGTDAQRAAGKQLYDQRCAQCHGAAGDAASIATPYFRPAPRDFTSGIFKFRTSPSGELPTDADLKRSIRQGMPYTGMPPWPQLSEAEVTNLVYYLKTFNKDFAGPYGVPDVIPMPRPPSFSEASAERGRQVYLDNQCFDCHGDQGRGDGPSAPTLEDQWGQPIRAADLTKRWTYRNGSTRQDIYRTFTTGLDGSPMPSFSVGEEDQWALVDYVYALSRDAPGYATHVVARYVDGPLDLSPARFADAPPAYFPIVGQVIDPGRAYHPAVNGIEVRAVYNDEDIAFLLVWHDVTAERAGRNGPGLPVAEPDTAAGGPYSDAVALQFPAAMPEGQAKPYLLYGDRRNAASLWFVDLAAGGVQVLTARGAGAFEPAPGAVDLQADFADGAWTAVFKRPRVQEDGLSFEPEAWVPVAFSVWDGFSGERGSKRGITSWYYVYLEPMQVQSAALPMAKYGLMTLLLELALVFFVRRKYREPVTA